MKMDLLTNATVVDDAIRFVSQKSKDKEEPINSDDEDDKVSRTPDYDKEKDQLEEKQGEQAEEVTTTTNQVF